MVLLSAAMLEKLFRELVLRMVVIRTGRDWTEARKRLRRLGRHNEGEEIFRDRSRMGLKEAIGKSGFPGFYDCWEDIRELRNKFMHGMPLVIGVSHTEKAFEVAKAAFGIFAGLHNQFCVDGGR